MTSPSNGVYKTPFTALAAYLYFLGHEVKVIDRSEPWGIKFVFDDSEELQKAVSEFKASRFYLYHQAYRAVLRKLHGNSNGEEVEP